MASITTQEVLRYPKLSVEVLSFPDVERIFHLTRADNTDWAQLRAPFELADHCKIVLKMIDAAISRSDGRPEMAVKIRLGILLDAVHATPPDPESPNSTPIPISSKCPFLFGPIVYNEVVHCLQGTPDWFLWYGPDAKKGKESVAINMVILETEHGQSADGVRQTLAYMSMIHTQRRAEGKLDSSVFGLSTDNSQFHFLQLNGESEWSRLDLNYQNHLQEIVGKLAYFHRHASILSASDRSDDPKKADSVFHVEDSGRSAVLVAISS